MDSLPALPAIAPATLRDVVRRVTQQELATVSDKEIIPLTGGFSGAHVYRLAGTAQADGGSVPWALVLKVLHADLARDDPAGWDYWKREALLYASGLLDELPGGLRAPRCFLVEECPPDTICLWLEALDAPVATPWTSDQYSTAARSLGRFNGAFLAGRPVPSAPWLPSSCLRLHVEARATAVAMLAAQHAHPLVRTVWPTANIAGVLRLWGERDLLLAAFDRLPQTFVHRDTTSRNLVVLKGDTVDDVVALDWGLAGPGVVGEDAGSLLLGALAFYDVAAEAAGALDGMIFDAYLDGLSTAGWTGETRLARLGYTASVALRAGLGFVANNVLALLRMTREQLEASCRAEHGRSLAEMAEISAALVAVILQLADEARRLVDRLR